MIGAQSPAAIVRKQGDVADGVIRRGKRDHIFRVSSIGDYVNLPREGSAAAG